MTNIQTVNREKIEAVKGLTAPQIKKVLLSLWEKYYNALILNSNIKKAEKSLENITFIKENANEIEFNKIRGYETVSEIHSIPIFIGVDLKENKDKTLFELAKSSLFSIIQKIETFNNMFSIVKDSLDNLNNNQSCTLANEIVFCNMFIKVVLNNKESNLIPIVKNTDLKLYNNFLKEKKPLINLLI